MCSSIATVSTGCDVGMPSTAACCSWSAQICCTESASAQTPSHCGHSSKCALPITTACISKLQRGQSSGASAASSVQSAFAPQWEQNFEPTNIIPKHEGQATVASRAPQCSHRGESGEAAAPHI